MSSCSRTCRRGQSIARSASRARRRAAFEIGSVDSRRVFVPRTDDAIAATERKRVEDAIEKLKDDKAVLQTAVQAAEMQKMLIGNLAQLPTRPAPANGAARPSPDWTQLFGLIGERLAEAQKTILDTQIKVRDVDRQIKDLEGKLASLAPAQEERTEVKVFVNAGAPLEAEMAIRYQVGGASWVPFYDARLATGTKAQAPKLQLVRRASIQQRTRRELGRGGAGAVHRPSRRRNGGPGASAHDDRLRAGCASAPRLGSGGRRYAQLSRVRRDGVVANRLR